MSRAQKGLMYIPTYVYISKTTRVTLQKWWKHRVLSTIIRASVIINGLQNFYTT